MSPSVTIPPVLIWWRFLVRTCSLCLIFLKKIKEQNFVPEEWLFLFRIPGHGKKILTACSIGIWQCNEHLAFNYFIVYLFMHMHKMATVKAMIKMQKAEYPAMATSAWKSNDRTHKHGIQIIDLLEQTSYEENTSFLLACFMWQNQRMLPKLPKYNYLMCHLCHSIERHFQTLLFVW